MNPRESLLDPQHPMVRLAKPLAGLHARWHQATLDGLEHLPESGALLVGNHGLFGLETPPFFYLLHEATGRLPVGLADKNLFGISPFKQILARIGGVPGTPENARDLLERGELVVCYPGGSRETFKPPEHAYTLQWGSAMGFAKVALAARRPIVPFAAAGVDESFLNFGPPEFLRARFGRYTAPFALGLGLLPLPVPFRFRLGAPIQPRDDERPEELKTRVQRAVESLLHGLVLNRESKAG